MTRMTQETATDTLASTTSEKNKLIEEYVEAGYTLQRLRGKNPIVKDWPSLPYDPLLTPNDLPKNYGIVLQDDDLIIDVDPRKFKEGDNPVVRLFKDLGIPEKPKTFIVRTGGEQPGMHIYYKKPADFKTRENIPEYPGLEFKAKGRHVVGPGSIHPDTRKAYGVVRGTPMNVLAAPEEMLTLIERTNEFDGEDIGEYRDDKATRHRYRIYLENCPIAIEGAGGDLTTYKCACEGRAYGLSPETTFDMMAEHWNDRCQPPWDLGDLRSKVRNAFRYALEGQGAAHPEYEFEDYHDANDRVVAEERANIRWDLNPNGTPKMTLTNTVAYFLTEDYQTYKNPVYRILRYNEFADSIEFNYPAPWHKSGRKIEPWNDTDAIMLKHYLSASKHYNTNVIMAHEAAVVVSQKFGSYHPVQNYLDNLEWDGVERLDRILIDYCSSPETPYVQAIGKNTLIAAVARIFNPGCQFDHILILEGKQGTGKSSFCRVLGGEWYGDINIDPHNKDTVDAMKGRWIIEASEMEFTRRADVQALKSFITKIADSVRPAYARTTRNFPRQCIFVGTINPEAEHGYLRDATGNRRFWPVQTGKIDLPKLKADRDQLWAEAVHRYRQGEHYYLSDKTLVELAETEQRKRTVDDGWFDIVEEWIHNTDSRNALPLILTASKIAQEALYLSPGRIQRMDLVRISRIMQDLGWEKGKFWSQRDGRTVNGYKRPIDHSVLDDL